MHCVLCNINYNMYYFKKHINAIKHIQQLKMLKQNLTFDEYNKHIEIEYNKTKITKNKKAKNSNIIKKGNFKIFF